MSDSFCVNPDQPADSDTDGPQLEVAAFTPQPAARSRSRSALSEGFCCSAMRSEEHTSELQSRLHLVCRLLLEKKKIRDNFRVWQQFDDGDAEMIEGVA